MQGKHLADAMEALIGTVFLLSGGASAIGMADRLQDLRASGSSEDDSSNNQHNPRGIPRSWDPAAVFSAIEAASLVAERIGVLPAGGSAVLRGVHSSWKGRGHSQGAPAPVIQPEYLPGEKDIKVFTRAY